MFSIVFLFLLSSILSATSEPFSYHHVHQQIAALDADPIELLDIMTSHINEHRLELSGNERDALVEQLKQLKQKFCWRPGAGFLALPMLATIVTGGYALVNYIKLSNIQDVPPWAKVVFNLEQKAFNDFLNSFFHFIVIAIAACLIEAEYRDTVTDLFAKERALERKIDELITLLQQ